MDLEKLKQLIAHPENEHVEFKEAARQFSFLGEGKFENRSKCVLAYCVAIGNEGGGYLLLGVKNDGTIMGTAMELPDDAKKKIFDYTGQKIEVFVISDGDKRVIAVSIPPHPVGRLLEYANVPLMRIKDSLEKMTLEAQTRALSRDTEDFSARPCAGTTVTDLDPLALAKLKEFYQKKNADNRTIATQSDSQFLNDVGLMKGNVPTYAALILLGFEAALKQHLANAEISFEYRNRANDIPYNDRVDYRKAFVLSAFEIWEKVSSRQQVHPIIEGFLRREIPAFNEEVFREALFNAVCHRDYTSSQAAVTICQSPEYLEITSPGGFPFGVSVENILTVPSTPRNRLLAEAFHKIFPGVERSGQGADKIFRITIEEGKGAPDYAKSDSHHVTLVIPAMLQDQNFVTYLQKIISEKQTSLSLEDIILLEKIRTGNREDITLKTVGHLLDLGFIEKHGNTRGAQYILSRRYYSETGKLGERTRRIGLPRDACKQLILEHLRKNKEGGTMREFVQVIPWLSETEISRLLKELKASGRVQIVGSRRWAKWHIKDF